MPAVPVSDRPEPAGLNLAVLVGHLSRDAEERTLGSGAVLVRYELTVPRPGERADTVPVVAVDPPAAGRGLSAGTEVVVAGRTRRRFWSAGGVTRSGVEVVAERVVPTRRRVGSTRVLTEALATLGSFADHEETTT